MTRWLSGRSLAKTLQPELLSRVKGLLNKRIQPLIQTILVGDNSASAIYVRRKMEYARSLGVGAEVLHLPSNTDEETLISHLKTFSEAPHIHGILLQLPLPPHLAPKRILPHICADKDADGLAPSNIGALLLDGEIHTTPYRPIPCTALGVMRLIAEALDTTPELAKTALSGKRALVVGRSILVGRPTSALLLGMNATVIQAHSATLNLRDELKNAEIVVAAAGVPGLVPLSACREGAIIIDVGTTRTQPTEGKVALQGDVWLDIPLESAKPAWLTPVPGGVGPMTIHSLIENTVRLCEAQNRAGGEPPSNP